MRFLEHDIADKNFLSYIKRFLKPGIMEDMKYHESDRDGLISPVCANVYLHYVLDMWFDKVVKKHCKGEAYIVRYADDCAPRRRTLCDRNCRMKCSCAAQKMRVGPSESLYR